MQGCAGTNSNAERKERKEETGRWKDNNKTNGGNDEMMTKMVDKAKHKNNMECNYESR